ncbi:S9 family peptidase [Zavarzinella formosa]|uniref:S9 family peptidase n=1 Tax=Zavarzinella formosa TaxID=360055 RepID=UPI0002D9F53C|nr:prolyl oligopeptidase family serine peptidase [Zavarzinella formosa]
MRTRFFRRLAALTLLGFGGYALAQDPAEAERAKQIVELEKQIAAIQKQITDLKNQPVRKPLSINDASTWKSVIAPTLSDDGVWFACRIGSPEIDSEVILQTVKGDKPQLKLPGGSSIGQIAFSRDSKWFAFTVSPTPSRPGGPPSTGKRIYKVVLVNLATNEKTEFEGLRSFAFNGEAATHIAFRKANPELTQPPAPPTNAPPSPVSNNDVILRELATGSELILGNVGEFAFNKKGTHLAMTIDALGQIGNGVQLRDMKTGSLQTLDTGKATYQSLNWKDTSDAFAVLKGVEETGVDGKVFSVVGFSDVGAATKKVVYEPKNDPAFPKDFGINSGRTPFWTDDLSGIFLGISTQKRPEPKKDDPKKDESKKDAPKAEVGPTPRTLPKPDMVIWHWKDERLQPAQQVRAAEDKAFNYLGLYRVSEKKFLRLADDTVKNVRPAPKHLYAVGLDSTPYQLMSTLDGKDFEDVYVTNLTTGERKKALTKTRFVFGVSTDGTHLAYNEDGHFKSLELATLKSYVMDEKAPKPFVNTEDDHNVDKMPTRFIGWSADGKFALVSDNWDIWQLAVHGETAVNLTVDGQTKGIRYRDRVALDPEEKGIDLTKPQLLSMYGEWTKKSGYGRLEAGKPGVTPLLFEDAMIRGVSKARLAEAYVYLRETSLESPEAHITDATFKTPRKVTDSNPQQANFLWSSGGKLIDYVGVNNKKLQGALFLPCSYQPGKKYPTIVYIYERLSQNFHSYQPPSTVGFNKSIYTSNGYAVLMPDITYQLNDPGVSSVKCILPALDAAIATGVVDGDKVGLHGHSWGGYQTAFAITQTDRFKAAIAGAPLTDLISMYSSVYWNTGSANQPIFESSQGRFTGPYWEQQEAYLRNSPVYHATKVKTPLLLLHNDKDGAVDWIQGIEYFNTLRRMQKPVVMLQYKGENHGLMKPENRKDYAIRMREFFDHLLVGKPAPDWWTTGVPHLKLEDHLKNRKD